MIKCNWARRYDRKVYARRLCLAPHTSKQTSKGNPLSYDRCKAAEKCWPTSARRISQPLVAAFTSLRLAARGKSISSHPQEIRLGGIVKPANLQVAKRLKTRGKRTGSTLLTRDGWKQVRGQRRAFRPPLLSKFPFVHLAWAAARGPAFSRFTVFRFFLDIGRTNAIKKRAVGFLTQTIFVFPHRVFNTYIFSSVGSSFRTAGNKINFLWKFQAGRTLRVPKEYRRSSQSYLATAIIRTFWRSIAYLRLQTATREISLRFSKSTTCL